MSAGRLYLDPTTGATVWDPLKNAVEQIRAKVRMVEADPQSFGVLSTGEKCAVALVLDDPELIKWWGSALDCVDRLEGDWIKAAIYVQRNGWES